MAKKGIDVSEHNGVMDWKKTKCDFALIRGGYGSGDVDAQFEHNVKTCTVPYGIYWFSYAYTVERAVIEAEKVISLLKGVKKPELPVFYDWEYDSDRYAKQNGVTVDKALYSKMAVAFMEKLREAGYEPGIYYNHDYYKSYCDSTVLNRKKYCQWYAYYGDTCTVDCDIWQYTEKGSLSGFTGDLNELRNEALLKKEEKPKPAPKPKPVQPGKNPGSRVLETGKNQVTNPFGGGHGGIDIVKETNELDGIVAHTAGTVIFCQTGIPNDQGSEGNRSYGNCVKLSHKNGYATLYAHMEYVTVKEGQSVKQGEKIGYMGNTGNSYGAHLHFEVRDKEDDRINPAPYINADLPGDKKPVKPEPAPKYKPGSYRVDADVLTVREGPGTSYDWKRYDELSSNARVQIAKLSGGTPNGYVKGMICDVSNVSGAWGQTPSGWICLDYCTKL